MNAKLQQLLNELDEKRAALAIHTARYQASNERFRAFLKLSPDRAQERARERAWLPPARGPF